MTVDEMVKKIDKKISVYQTIVDEQQNISKRLSNYHYYIERLQELKEKKESLIASKNLPNNISQTLVECCEAELNMYDDMRII